MFPIVIDALEVVSQSGVESWLTVSSSVPGVEKDHSYLVGHRG